MSLAEVSYLIVQALRKNGVKGIAKPTRAFEAAKRFENIFKAHNASPAALKACNASPAA